MAEKESKANVTHDEFVGKLVKDPKSPPDTILLTGYLGKSSEEGHTRLYFDPELKSYIEIPNEAILHSQQIPEEQSALGGSNVWIARDAEVVHGRVGPSRTKAKFFQGPIGAAAAAAGGGGVAGPGGGAGNSVLPACVVTDASVCVCPGTILAGDCPTVIQCLPPTLQWTQCATPLHGCPPPTQITQCPTPLHGCPTPPALCVHTPFPRCLPHFTPACPIQSANCPSPACFTVQPIACVPHLTPNCPIQTANACPSFAGCPSGPACVVNPVGGGVVDPAAQAQALGINPTSPVVCQVFTPACPSLPHICVTNPVVCVPSPFCPSPHHICPSNPVVCQPSPFCPSRFVICQSAVCPSVHIPCQTTPGCPFPTAGCPFNPGGGGGNPIG
jgi:hypothetical protein